jgi:hypothetical protein
VILDSLVWNSILGSIEMLLHNWWTANVRLLNLTSFLESHELFVVGLLVHSLALWLSQLGIFINLTNSGVVGEQVLITILLAQISKEIEKLKAHGLWLTSE